MITTIDEFNERIEACETMQDSYDVLHDTSIHILDKYTSSAHVAQQFNLLSSRHRCILELARIARTHARDVLRAAART